MMSMRGGFLNSCLGRGSVKEASPIFDAGVRVAVGGGLVVEDDTGGGDLVGEVDSCEDGFAFVGLLML
jgi:hypothetical protein